MRKDKLDYADPSLLYRVRDYMAKGDEYSVFGPICSEMGLAQDHAGVLEVMDKNTSMSWNEMTGPHSLYQSRWESWHAL